MAKTITLKSTVIQSITVNNLEFGNQISGASKGLASHISYAVVDDKGDHAFHSSSTKYTSDSNYDTEKMSETAETHLKAYMDEMNKLMTEREEL